MQGFSASPSEVSIIYLISPCFQLTQMIIFIYTKHNLPHEIVILFAATSPESKVTCVSK